MKSRIINIKTANPPLKVHQKEMIPLMLAQDIPERRKKYYRRFLSDDGVVTRTFGIGEVSQVINETHDQSAKRFERVAVELATRAARQCMEAEEILPHQIDGL
ncbi:MAG: hypothetical protein KGJ11_06770, partial [Candidatus Omnitrophica bacterium]|nr:hypothetical protein [Candidatus Omnitrophota bacterium]